MTRRAPEPLITRIEEEHFKKEAAHVLASMTPYSSPTNNMGGKSTNVINHLYDYPDFSKYEHPVLCADGSVKLQLLRKATTPDAAFIDQISFTFHESDCVDYARNDKNRKGSKAHPVHKMLVNGYSFVDDMDYIRTISLILFRVFGFGVTHEREKGLNYYARTWKLGTDDALYGHVSFGGQRETVLVQITGTGAMAARDGWERRLHHFLSAAQRGKVTRVDLARDFLNGEYTVSQAYQEYDKGAFCSGGRWPTLERHGDWERPNGSGRTLYVGKRSSGKFCRVYEKGCQLGEKNSPWNRLEVELKSIDRVIPFDVLLYPGEYLAAAYPAFEFIDATPARIETQQKRIGISRDKAVFYAQQQVGRLINYLKDQEGCDAENIISLLSRPDGSYPKRLNLSLYSAEYSPAVPLHEQTPRQPYDEFNMSKNYFGGNSLTA